MVAVDFRAIEAAYWQPLIGTLGAIVTDLDDINQCILTILLTPKGSDPLRPEFALNLFDYVDRPINAIRAPLVRDVVQAIQRWEKRADIQRVTLDPQDDLAGWILSVTWTPSGQVNQDQEPQATRVLVPVTGGLVTSPFVAIPFLSSAPAYTGVDGGTVA